MEVSTSPPSSYFIGRAKRALAGEEESIFEDKEETAEARQLLTFAERERNNERRTAPAETLKKERRFPSV